MKKHRTFLDEYREHESDWASRLESLHELTVELTARHLPDAVVEARLKRPRSVWKKMCRDQLVLSEVHDLLGLRIIVDSIEQCYHAVTLVEALFPGRCLKLKDYIAAPKNNGYRSLHLWLSLNGGLRLEVQIRTRLMHLRCLVGDTSHRRYKRQMVVDSSQNLTSKGVLDRSLEPRVSELASTQL